MQITPTQEWHRVLVFTGLGLAVAIASPWPTLVHMASVWGSAEAYRHGWLVLPLLTYLVFFQHREEFFSRQPQPGFSGVVLALVAASLWVVGSVVEIQIGKHIAVTLILMGIVLCALGWRLFLHSIVLWLLLLFMVPVGDLLNPLLRDLTVWMIHAFAMLANLPLTIDEYTLYVGSHRYAVVNACAGLSYVTMASFLSYGLASLRSLQLPRVLGAMMVGALLGVLANGIRVSSIIWMDWTQGTQMALTDHLGIHRAAIIGLLALLLVLGLLEISMMQREYLFSAM